MANKNRKKGGGGGKGGAPPARDPILHPSWPPALAAMGVLPTKDGGLHIDPQALARLREDQLRHLSLSSVPSLPRNVPRDAGGIAVAKGAAGVGEILSFAELRRVKKASYLFQAIHAARHAQIRRLSQRWNGKPWMVGWRVVHRDHTAHNAQAPASIRPVLQRAERILQKPAPHYKILNTGALLEGLWEDLATINRPALEPLRSPLDGSVTGFRPIDGALIWETAEWVQHWMATTPEWFGRWDPKQLTDADKFDLASAAIDYNLHGAAWCLVREQTVEAVYRPQELLVAPLQVETDVNLLGYPPSYVEMCVEIGLSWINATEYTSGRFTRGMLIDFFLAVSGNLDGPGLKAFQDQWREATQGVGRAHQPPILNVRSGEVTPVSINSSPREMGFESWLAFLGAIGCAIYRMDPSTVNFRPWGGGASPGLSEGNRTQEIALAKEEGLQADMQHLVESLLDPAVQLIHPDLCVLLEYGDYDAKKAADVHEVQVRTRRTINEVRLEEGDRPLGPYVTDEDWDTASDEEKAAHEANPYNNVQNQTLLQWNQQKQQEAQQQQQMQQGPDGGAGGDPNAQPGAAPFGQPPSAADGDPFGGEADPAAAGSRELPKPPQAQERPTPRVDAWSNELPQGRLPSPPGRGAPA